MHHARKCRAVRGRTATELQLGARISARAEGGTSDQKDHQACSLHREGRRPGARRRAPCRGLREIPRIDVGREDSRSRERPRQQCGRREVGGSPRKRIRQRADGLHLTARAARGPELRRLAGRRAAACLGTRLIHGGAENISGARACRRGEHRECHERVDGEAHARAEHLGRSTDESVHRRER